MKNPTLQQLCRCLAEVCISNQTHLGATCQHRYTYCTAPARPPSCHPSTSRSFTVRILSLLCFLSSRRPTLCLSLLRCCDPKTGREYFSAVYGGWATCCTLTSSSCPRYPGNSQSAVSSCTLLNSFMTRASKRIFELKKKKKKNWEKESGEYIYGRGKIVKLHFKLCFEFQVFEILSDVASVNVQAVEGQHRGKTHKILSDLHRSHDNKQKSAQADDTPTIIVSSVFIQHNH